MWKAQMGGQTQEEYLGVDERAAHARDVEVETFVDKFAMRFDIDKVKDRAEHAYIEGADAEEQVKNYLKEELYKIL